MCIRDRYEAIKHQGARGDSAEAGKLSLESVGQRNGMSVKTVQRYIWLNDLVPVSYTHLYDGCFVSAACIMFLHNSDSYYICN